MKKISSHQTIIEALNTFYGLRTDKLALVTGGADLDASAYRADTGNGSYFVKIKRGALSPIVATIFELLNSVGIQHIIQPVKTIQGHVVQQLKDFSLIVFPFIDGTNGFERDLTHPQWVALGETLRQIHTIVVPAQVQGLIKSETYSPQWRDKIRSLYPQIAVKTAGEKAASNVIQFLIDHKAVILRLIDRAEQLSQEIQKLRPSSVLCHSDIHAGNILMSRADEFYIVDWDSPILAPKERDLMFIGGGVAGVWNRSIEEELFYKGYGPTNVSSTVLAYYRHERIVEDIAIYAQELISSDSETPDWKIMYKQFTEMFEPGNVVEIAFKTGSELLQILK